MALSQALECEHQAGHSINHHPHHQSIISATTTSSTSTNKQASQLWLGQIPNFYRKFVSGASLSASTDWCEAQLVWCKAISMVGKSRRRVPISKRDNDLNSRSTDHFALSNTYPANLELVFLKRRRTRTLKHICIYIYIQHTAGCQRDLSWTLYPPFHSFQQRKQNSFHCTQLLRTAGKWK